MGEKDGKSEGGEKKVEEKGPIQVVLKVDMHCDGCAKKIKKSVKGFAGVETVEADSASNKLTVKGKVDPVKLLERVESKTKKKVQLISPQPPKKDEKKEAEKKGDDKKPDQKKPEEKKKETTVVYKTRLHCEGCIQKIRRLVKKHKGVQTVAIDGAKDLITVTGTMDPKDLQASLKEKFNRPVDIVPPKKDEKKEDGKEGGGGGDKKEGGGGGDKKEGGGGDKKEGGGGDKGKGGEKKEGGGDKKEGGGAPKVEGMKMDHYGYPTYPIYEHGFPSHIPPPPPPEYANGYGQGYAVQYVHAPQIFSDENPNACSVM